MNMIDPKRGGPEPVEETRRDDRDLPVRWLAAFAGALVALAVATHVALWFYERHLAARAAARDAPDRPLLVAPPALPPRPRIQVDERADFEAFRRSEDAVLDTYDLSDPAPGAVRVPISRAMDLIAQEGLPARPSASAPEIGAPAPFESGLGPRDGGAR
jgi:hypothetical protein